MDIKILASGSSGNCYRISDYESSLLLDAGIPFKEIQKGLQFKLSDISGCLLTHSHGDHSKAVKDLAKHGIDVFSSAGTFNELRIFNHRTRIIPTLSKQTIGSFTVMPFDVEHDTAEPLGFLVKSNVTGEKLLYFTDTAYLRYKFKGIHYILGEVNYSLSVLQQNIIKKIIDPGLAKRIIKSHMSLENFVEFLKANESDNLQAVYLLHLSDTNSDEELLKTQIKSLTKADVIIC